MTFITFLKDQGVHLISRYSGFRSDSICLSLRNKALR